MKLWIPGANGLLGTALCSSLSKAGNVPFVGTNHKQADITDLPAIRAFARAHLGITHIVNCAAYSLVDLSETHREEAYLANAIGPENLAVLAREIGAKLLHVSTDYVFSGNGNKLLSENDPVAPSSYYGKTKLEGEERVQWTLSSACILRVSWLFGPGGKNFVSKLLQLLQEKNEIQLTNDQWGRPTYAPDAADAILKLLDHSGIYHFANTGIATKYEFGVAMKEELKNLGASLAADSILPVPGSMFQSPCKRPVFTAFDTAKIERHLKMAIRPWRAALQEFLQETQKETRPSYASATASR